MKKIVFCLMAIFLSLTFVPFQSNAATTDPPSTLAEPKTAESPEVKVLLLRLEEIKAKDMSTLTSSERKALRKELKSINKELNSPGVYISVTVLLLIIILLILLL